VIHLIDALNTISFLALMGCLLFAIDDLFIDGVATLFQLKPQKLSDADLISIHQTSQKRIGIMIANWHEEDVIDRMILGNLGGIDYQNYVFFLGVYPNDRPTLDKALLLQKRFSNVFVVVNSKNGPTSKGQMLNQIVTHIKGLEQSTETFFDLILMQDSEDVLHPLSLKILNWGAKDYDFIQMPVFSFNLPIKHWTGSTYIDEFSEVHTKDLLVREFLGCAIPSAGVGTAFSRKMIDQVCRENSGAFFAEDVLVEDYFLGTQTKKLNLKSRFLCCYRDKTASKPRDFIATREYFPNQISTAIRQKTRWTLGIAVQGLLRLGWSGSVVDRYFLMRDRRGPFNALVMILCTLSLIGYALCELLKIDVSTLTQNPIFILGTKLTLISMIIRLVQRSRCVLLVNGWKPALTVALRWPLANWINTLAAAMAVKKHIESVRAGVQPKWDKTAHILPENFGHNSEVSETHLIGAQ
jgi:bacteriophage N4 adsorption protein B